MCNVDGDESFIGAPLSADQALADFGQEVLDQLRSALANVGFAVPVDGRLAVVSLLRDVVGRTCDQRVEFLARVPGGEPIREIAALPAIRPMLRELERRTRLAMPSERRQVAAACA